MSCINYKSSPESSASQQQDGRQHSIPASAVQTPTGERECVKRYSRPRFPFMHDKRDATVRRPGSPGCDPVSCIRCQVSCIMYVRAVCSATALPMSTVALPCPSMSCGMSIPMALLSFKTAQDAVPSCYMLGMLQVPNIQHRFIPLTACLPAIPSLGPGCRSPGPAVRARHSRRPAQPRFTRCLNK